LFELLTKCPATCLADFQAEEVAMDEHPILVGYDGAAGSGAALRWALHEAVRRGLGVRLVRVLDLGRAGSAPSAGSMSSVEADLLDEAKVALDKVGSEATAELRGAVTLNTVALPGPVVSSLCEQSGQVSMVVLGGRGTGGFAGLLLGSVSVAVAVHAQCPVVVVRDDVCAPGAPVVVGVDDSDEARLAVEFAFAEAAAREVELVAVHAAPPAGARHGGVNGNGGPAAGRDLVDAALRDGRARYAGVPVSVRVLPGSPGQVLAGSSRGAQLLVVGSRGRGGFHGLPLGSVSLQVLYRAQCPVAVVRRHPAGVRGSTPARAQVAGGQDTAR
jgi:nucleotide-binding universal stress UspA family protein